VALPFFVAFASALFSFPIVDDAALPDPLRLCRRFGRIEMLADEEPAQTGTPLRIIPARTPT